MNRDIKLALGFGLTHCRPADDGLVHQVVESRPAASRAAAVETEESAADHYTAEPTLKANASRPAEGRLTIKLDCAYVCLCVCGGGGGEGGD